MIGWLNWFMPVTMICVPSRKRGKCSGDGPRGVILDDQERVAEFGDEIVELA